MKPDNQKSKWLRPITFFIIAYLVILSLAGSFVITVGPQSMLTFGYRIMAFGIGAAVIGFFIISNRSPRGINGIAVHPHDRTQNPIAMPIFVIIIASLSADATGPAICNFAPY
jgi:hypothetical protein